MILFAVTVLVLLETLAVILVWVAMVPRQPARRLAPL